MATDTRTSERQSAPSGGQGLTRTSQRSEQGRGFPLGSVLTPAEFFRMTPFTLASRMMDEMDRAFSDFVGGARQNASEASQVVWVPAIEISEREGKYVIRAELPGLNPNDVKLEVTDEAIILQGERKAERNEDERGIHVTERVYGRFFRSIPLPEGAKAEEARAKFENGVLEVIVPVKEQRTQRREIQIEGRSAVQGSDKAQGSEKSTTTEKAA